MTRLEIIKTLPRDELDALHDARMGELESAWKRMSKARDTLNVGKREGTETALRLAIEVALAHLDLRRPLRSRRGA